MDVVIASCDLPMAWGSAALVANTGEGVVVVVVFILPVQDLQHLCLLLGLVDRPALMDYGWRGLNHSHTHMGVPPIPALPSITSPQAYVS